jgi:hypothetical protein
MVVAAGAVGCATTDEHSSRSSTNGGPTPTAGTGTPAPAANTGEPTAEANTGTPAVTTGEGPCLVVFRDGATRGPTGPRLETAVWTDGKMLLVSRIPGGGGGGGGGTPLVLVAQTERAEVARVLRVVREAGFYSAPRAEYLVPDSGYQVILAHDGTGKGRCAWHGQLNPGFGGDLSSDRPYRDFVTMWRRVRGNIDTLPLTNVQRLQDLPGGTTGFRGYDVADPAQTPWLK